MPSHFWGYLQALPWVVDFMVLFMELVTYGIVPGTSDFFWGGVLFRPGPLNIKAQDFERPCVSCPDPNKINELFLVKRVSFE